MTGAVKELRSKQELEAAVKRSVAVLHFWATWCEPSKAMEPVFAQLAVDAPQAKFFRVEAEEQPEISEAYEVAAVPFFLILKVFGACLEVVWRFEQRTFYIGSLGVELVLACQEDGVVVDKLQGANAPELANKVAKWAGPNTTVREAAPATVGLASGANVIEAVKKDLTAHATHQHTPPGKTAAHNSLAEVEKGELHKLVNSKPVLLFMKGTAGEPRCGFSRKVVEALNGVGVQFDTFDILSDETVRQGLKTYSNWPTFPQLYVQGELLGGCDIILEMKENGELKEIFEEKGLLTAAPPMARTFGVPEQPASQPLTTEKAATTNDGSDLKTRIHNLINEQPIMLFMKGNPTNPQCGFSRKVVQALAEEQLEYGSFNILSDEDVRQGLKEYSNWPTYPQLYVKGEFIGGCDIILEMHHNGELKEVLGEKGLLPKESLDSRLKKLISSSNTMLFMKGTPDEPRCGFSTKVVNALREEGIHFGSFNILEDEEVRQGLKTYSNWPTFPQLYYKGELLGGCDIVMEMKAGGELKSSLSE